VNQPSHIPHLRSISALCNRTRGLATAIHETPRLTLKEYTFIDPNVANPTAVVISSWRDVQHKKNWLKSAKIPWSKSDIVLRLIISFHPEMALFRDLCVKLWGFWFGVLWYASAQSLDFFAELGPTLSAWVPGSLDLAETGHPPRRGGTESPQGTKKIPDFCTGNFS
jgi:hypothetical protein